MTTLKEEDPLAYVAESKWLDSTCSFCLADDKPVRKCSGCHVLYYCDENCQKGDWVNHKKECRFFKANLMRGIPQTDVRLAMRILVKSKEELAQKAFNGRTWDSLDDHVSDVKARAGTQLGRVIDFLNFYLKTVKNVSVPNVTTIYCKVLTNCLGMIESHRGEPIGLGLFVGLSANKHSCLPDAQLIFHGTKASLRSFDEQCVYSSNLTYSYTSLVPWHPERSSLFNEIYFRECTCLLCTDKNHIFNRMGSSCHVDCCEDAAGVLDDGCSGFYLCNKCGRASRISPKEVKRVEAKLRMGVVKINDPEYEMDVENIKHLVRESEMFLSTYNYHYLNLCDAVISWTANRNHKIPKENAYRMVIYLYDKKLKVMRYYLHDADKRETRGVVERALFKMLYKFNDDFYVDQALDAAERTYGKRDPFFIELQMLIEGYKLKNAIKREEEYRIMCRYGW